MTEKIKIFCNKLKMFLDSMKHREELILKTDDSFCDMIFNHEIKIEKLHNVNLSNAIPFLMMDHKVNLCSGRRILIETYTFVEKLMLNTTYYYGYAYLDGSFGMEIDELELMERTRLVHENSVVNFNELFRQMDHALVKFV